jgi:predicted nucleic acid-binding protein
MVNNMESVLLDTSVWVDALKGKTPHIGKMTQVCLHHQVFLFTLDEHFRSVPRLKIFEFA